MLVFPNAKINIGLNIVTKRKDGYHNIETVFYPVFQLYDAIEIIVADKLSLNISGLNIDGNIEDNLIIRAYRLLQKDYKLPVLAFFIKKSIPMGAGLGGGSSDAAFTLKAINSKFNLHLSNSDLCKYAEKLGADCSFFIYNQTSFAQGKGEILTPFDLCLQGKYLLLIKPNIDIKTKEAYDSIKTNISRIGLMDAIQRPVKEWKNTISNDFEKNIFTKYPLLHDIKNKIYDNGAIYASMSGSGSTIYGIFENNPKNISFDKSYYQKTVLL